MNMALKSRSRINRASGFSLMELVVSAALMGFVLIVIGELVSLNVLASVKLSNRADTLNAARFTVEKISSEVRSSMAFGDAYASPSNRNMYPDNANNPFFSSTASTWSSKWPPQLPTPWPSPVYLDDQCLILQKPTVYLDKVNDSKSAQFDAGAAQNPLNGLPTYVDKNNPGTPITSTTEKIQNLDTIIYRLFPDPRRDGEYVLKKVFLPGANFGDPACTDYNSHLVIDDPQTVLTGIVGPISPTTGKLSIFRYNYISQSGSRKPVVVSTSPVPPNLVPLLYGVSIDVELRKPDASTKQTSGDGLHSSRLAIHVEATKRLRKSISH